ncbi:MAG TPA: hypothetical protein VH561_06000 [Micromonosporaceae bacterium]|jgi:hypothetical protein
MSVPDDRTAEDHLVPEERDPEASPEDVAEQATPADPGEGAEPEIHVNVEASEWDAIEQARVVELEDDYREP